MIVTPSQRQSISRRLLTWFRRNARVVPWRSNRDPYRIWVSEVMLQQTQVATVIPYFERFLRRFPTLAEIAMADEQEVLRYWEGLGYYRRARSLWRAARHLNDGGHQTVPDDLEVVRALPGFGRYTANAVLSQAYDRRVTILEANSQRVLCRLFGIKKDPREALVREQLWQLSEAILPARSVGDFNQALMELGALVCTPSQPKCSACPVRAHCQANSQGSQNEIPVRAKATATVAVNEVAIVVGRRNQFLLVQRPDEGLWAGMWEFPHHPLESMESLDAGARRLLSTIGLECGPSIPLDVIRHSVTRFRITMTCLQATYRVGVVRLAGYRSFAWISAEDLAHYPLSAPQRRLARRLMASNTLARQGRVRSPKASG